MHCSLLIFQSATHCERTIIKKLLVIAEISSSFYSIPSSSTNRQRRSKKSDTEWPVEMSVKKREKKILVVSEWEDNVVIVYYLKEWCYKNSQFKVNRMAKVETDMKIIKISRFTTSESFLSLTSAHSTSYKPHEIYYVILVGWLLVVESRIERILRDTEREKLRRLVLLLLFSTLVDRFQSCPLDVCIFLTLISPVLFHYFFFVYDSGITWRISSSILQSVLL